MIIIPYIEEWNKALLKITDLILLYEKKDFKFEEACVKFATGLEELAGKQGLSLQNEISLIKGEMLRAGRKQIEGETTAGRRKRKENEILEAVGKIKDTVNEFLEKDRTAIEESKTLLRQAAAVVATKTYMQTGERRLLGTDEVMRVMYGDNELIPVITMAVGKAGRVNCRILIDQVLSEVV